MRAPQVFLMRDGNQLSLTRYPDDIRIWSFVKASTLRRSVSGDGIKEFVDVKS
jgi:hypothetical protein